MSHLRAIIFKDRVLIFDPQEPYVETFIKSLTKALDTHDGKPIRHSMAATESGSTMCAETLGLPLTAAAQASDDTVWNPFEFRVLEHCLASVCDKYGRRILFCTPVVDSLLRGLQSTVNVPDENQLHRLFPLRESLSSFHAASGDILRAVDLLLKQDEDMARMCLTYQDDLRQAGEAGDPALTDAWVNEMEMLLQTYHSKISNITRTITRLLGSIESAQDMMTIHMNNYRNHLIHVNLQLAMLTTSLGLGTFVAGLFGMNLVSNLELVPGLFYAICGTSIGMGALFFWRYQRYARLTTPSVDRVQGMSVLASQIDFLAGTIIDFGVTKQVVSKQQFRQMVEGLGIRSDEVDIIFDAFDTDEDGLLEYDEYLALLDKDLPSPGPMTQTEQSLHEKVRLGRARILSSGGDVI